MLNIRWNWWFINWTNIYKQLNHHQHDSTSELLRRSASEPLVAPRKDVLLGAVDLSYLWRLLSQPVDTNGSRSSWWLVGGCWWFIFRVCLIVDACQWSSSSLTKLQSKHQVYYICALVDKTWQTSDIICWIEYITKHIQAKESGAVASCHWASSSTKRATKKNEASAKQLEINASLALFPTVFVPTQVIWLAPTLNELTNYMIYKSCLANYLLATTNQPTSCFS